VPLFDLSHPMDESILLLPGAPPLTLHRYATIAKDGLNDTEARFAVHTGTHIDAPNHVFDDRRGIEAITLEELCGPAVGWSVDLGPGEAISVAELERQTPRMQRGDRVFIHTGWGKHYLTDHQRYLRHPHLSDEAARWLVGQGAQMVAMDTLSPDLAIPLRPQGFRWPVHQILVGAEVLIVENAANLDTVAGKRFRVYALPLPLRGADASPARIVAEVE
jgi:kynurenine formamidase